MNLITDRTLDDVLKGTPKGQYSIEDLNRVERAAEELYTVAVALGIEPPGAFKTDWDATALFSAQTWPTQGQMQRYLKNITHLCAAVELAGDLPSSMENLTWEGANYIEKSLLLAYPRIQNALQIFRFSGEIFAGEES